jgi:hypothetical protein
MDLGQQPHLLITDPHEAAFNVDLEPTLVELATIDDVDDEAKNVVSIEQCPMLPILAHEEDGSAPHDPHDRAIAKSHSVDDASVEIREDLLDTGHVVGGPYVKDPPLGVSFSHLLQHDVDLLFHQLNVPLWHR